MKNALRHSVHTVLQTGEKGDQRQGGGICYLAKTHLTLGDPVYGAFPCDFNPVLHRNQSGAQKC